MVRISNRAKQITEFIVFWAVALVFGVLATYLLRPADPVGRINILGYYKEPDNTIDVVYLGASGSYRYYSPMEAWETSGITSYTYSVGGMQAMHYITALEDIARSQSPGVVIVDARRFTSDNIYRSMEGRFYRYLDSLDIGTARLKGLFYSYDVLQLSLKDIDILADFADLFRYHSNYTSLISADHWKYILNRAPKRLLYKGFRPTQEVEVQTPFPGMTTKEEAQLDEMALRIYYDFLEYCEEQEYEILLVVSPYSFDEEIGRELNTLARIAEEYDVPFLNLNTLEIYEQMGLDFDTDFYNPHHMNSYGAEKYTAYITSYLAEHYQLPDHRGSTAYADWERCYKQYLQTEKS